MYFYRKRKNYGGVDEVYAKADTAHYKRHARNPQYYTWEQFEQWREKAKEVLKVARRGEISEDRLKEILKPNTIV